MKRIIITDEPLIQGTHAREIIKIIPSIEDKFIRYNDYGEYIMTWGSEKINITIGILEKLNKTGFQLTLTDEHLIIKP